MAPHLTHEQARTEELEFNSALAKMQARGQSQTNTGVGRASGQGVDNANRLRAQLRRLRTFLLSKEQEIKSIEGIAPSLVYMLPAPFDGELLSVAFEAAFNLKNVFLDNYHEGEVDSTEVLQHSPLSWENLQHSPRARLKLARIIITLLSNIELMVEMVSLRGWFSGGNAATRWKVVRAIEALKVLLRVAILLWGGRRASRGDVGGFESSDVHTMLVSGAAYVAKPKSLPDAATAAGGADAASGAGAASSTSTSTSSSYSREQEPEQLYYRGPRSGKLMPVTPEAQRFMRRARVKRFSTSEGGNSDSSSSSSRKMVSSNNVPSATSPERLERARMLSLASEVLYIARPLVFADIVCRRAVAGGEEYARASWLPLLASLAADAGSAALRAWAERETAAAL